MDRMGNLPNRLKDLGVERDKLLIREMEAFLPDVVSSLRHHIIEIEFLNNNCTHEEINEVCHKAIGLSGIFNLEYAVAIFTQIAQLHHEKNYTQLNSLIKMGNEYLDEIEGNHVKTI